MMRLMSTCCVAGLLIVFSLACADDPGFQMKPEVTGVLTNCYLVYDSLSREAALIDVGGPIDSLLDHIDERQLRVTYFLFTHGHPDHVVGLADIRQRFPEARICMHRADFEDLQLIQDWLIDDLGPATSADRAAHPELAMLIDFDAASFPEPDIFLRDNDTIELGDLTIRAIHTPGHSPGSICYHAGNMMFSGDVLFHRAVGRVDLPNSSADDQVSSVRRLLSQFPESTRVYPGHGEPTDIGSEKRENKKE